MLASFLPAVCQSIAAGAPEDDAGADDVIDFFAMAIASVLDNDSRLTTLRHLRIGAETAAKHIERRAKEFRAMKEEMETSWSS